MSEPLVCAGQWRQVMRAAGYRCQCTGACSSSHSKGGGRCDREHDTQADKGPQRLRLTVAPADPALDETTAAGTPTSCGHGAGRAATPSTAPPAPPAMNPTPIRALSSRSDHSTSEEKR